MTASTSLKVTVAGVVAILGAFASVAWAIVSYHANDVSEIRAASAAARTQNTAEHLAIRDKALDAADKAASIAGANAGEIKSIASKIEGVQTLLQRIDTDRREQNAQILQTLQRLERRGTR